MASSLTTATTGDKTGKDAAPVVLGRRWFRRCLTTPLLWVLPACLLTCWLAIASRYELFDSQLKFGSGGGGSRRAEEHTQFSINFKPGGGGGGVQQKTVESSKLRLVFVVGLEGAGHHYLIKALESFQDGALWLNKCPMSKPYVVMNAMDEGPGNYTAAVEQASFEMSALALEEQKRQLAPDGSLEAAAAVATMQGSILPPNPHPCDGVGMLSYPTFSGFDKVGFDCDYYD